MATRLHITADRRETVGKKVSRLRRKGVLPAVVYGHGRESESIQLDARAFNDTRRKAGRNALLDLQIDGGRAVPVLLHHVQEHPVSRAALHADFLVVRMTEEMMVDVPIAMIGASEAVDKEGGTLLHLRDSVQVRALPADLPSSLELDVTPLDSFETVLHVSDLVVPEGVTLLTDLEEPLARVQPPRLEVEPTTAEEAAVEEGEAEEGAPEAAAAEGESAGGTAPEAGESAES